MSGASVSVSAVIPTPEPTPTQPDTTEHPSTDKPSDTTDGGTGGNVDFDPSKMLTLTPMRALRADRRCAR